jgi:peptide deformylase
MTIHKILIEPDPLLRKQCKLVTSVNDNLRKLMDDMLETMYDAPGIGLAAIQIGVSERVVVIDINKGEEKAPLYLVNPEITFQSKEKSKYEEGCLSLPGQFAEIERASECHLKYLDYNGNTKELKAKGLLATCIQHEVDHLEGILFIDYLSKLKKTMIIKKLTKQKKSLERIVV